MMVSYTSVTVNTVYAAADAELDDDGDGEADGKPLSVQTIVVVA